MKLNEIRLPQGRKARKKKRLGRGDASGHGGTSCRGHKGQKARAGGYHKVGFEGGQMPLSRRLPKRGFKNIFRKEFEVVNLDQLSVFPSGSEVDIDSMINEGLVKKSKTRVVVLGRGDLKHALVIKASRFSDSAKQKIEAKGGKAEVLSA